MDPLDYRQRVYEADRITSIARTGKDEIGGEIMDPGYSQEVAATLALVEATLALAAALHDGPPPEVAEAGPATPPTWARLELFGHAVVYGQVVEVERYGRRWLEVTEPAMWKDDAVRDGDPDVPERSKLYHPNAVYAFAEIDEQEARNVNRRRAGLDIDDRYPWDEDDH